MASLAAIGSLPHLRGAAINLSFPVRSPELRGGLLGLCNAHVQLRQCAVHRTWVPRVRPWKRTWGHSGRRCCGYWSRPVQSEHVQQRQRREGFLFARSAVELPHCLDSAVQTLIHADTAFVLWPLPLCQSFHDVGFVACAPLFSFPCFCIIHESPLQASSRFCKVPALVKVVLRELSIVDRLVKQSGA